MMQPICILTGQIVHGKGLGRTVGMPTANLQVSDADVLPECGVYATRIRIGGRAYDAVTNIGRRPSVDAESHVTIETHIIDFNEDIYGQEVVLEVLLFLRPIQTFSGLQEVRRQVQKDIEEVKKLS